MTSNDARDTSNVLVPVSPTASTASVDAERALVMADDISRAQHVADLDGNFRRRVRARGRQYTDFRNLRIRENGGKLCYLCTAMGHLATTPSRRY